MKWFSPADAAKKWGLAEQTIRRYCRKGLIPEAVQSNNSWLLPYSAKCPVKCNYYMNAIPPLLGKLIKQKKTLIKGLYNYIQINMAYSSSRMASNRLTRNHVECLYRSGRLLATNESMKLNDYIEVRNHFLCVDKIIDEGIHPLNITYILNLHKMLFSDICGHKNKPIETGKFRTGNCESGFDCYLPANEVRSHLSDLLSNYEDLKHITLYEILDLHVQFERIRPFEDGNGRIGRLIILKECLRHNITPFIIDDKRRFEYLRGIRDWDEDPTLLHDLCRECQSRFISQIELQELLDSHSRIMRQFKRELFNEEDYGL